MIKRLTKIPTGQVKVIVYDNGDISLVSYTTEVATIKAGWLEIYGLYSATTRKHISAFVSEYCGLSYATAKQLYIDGYRYNIFTGEIE